MGIGDIPRRLAGAARAYLLENWEEEGRAWYSVFERYLPVRGW